MKNMVLPTQERGPCANPIKQGSAAPAKLPLLVSVPHGGYAVPIDLMPQLSLRFDDIFTDSDPCTRDIYAFADEVHSFHAAEIARAVMDLNRGEDDLPPKNPDGVVKSQTVMGASVYKPGFQPRRVQIEELLERFYYPYHQRIARDCADPTLICALDCHSMLDMAPGDGGDDRGGDRRPFICLSNCGDANGEGNGDELSCPPEMLQLLAECLQSEFPDEADNIVLNEPFSGGYLTRAHSRELPWIQVELNRRAYLSDPWFDPVSLQVSRRRIRYLRDKFLQAFVRFCDEAVNNQWLQSGSSVGGPSLYDNSHAA